MLCFIRVVRAHSRVQSISHHGRAAAPWSICLKNRIQLCCRVFQKPIEPMVSATTPAPHRIIVVGGGAGGLELVTRLGDTLGKSRKALVTLVDKSRTHLWKPLLHQVAAGSMDLNDHELDYLYQARW